MTKIKNFEMPGDFFQSLSFYSRQLTCITRGSYDSPRYTLVVRREYRLGAPRPVSPGTFIANITFRKKAEQNHKSTNTDCHVPPFEGAI